MYHSVYVVHLILIIILNAAYSFARYETARILHLVDISFCGVLWRKMTYNIGGFFKKIELFGPDEYKNLEHFVKRKR